MKNDFGFYKIGAATLDLRVGDVKYNLQQLKKIIASAAGKGVKVLVTPEMSLCAYSCGDLFLQQSLIDACTGALCEIAHFCAPFDMAVVVGLPVYRNSSLYNCAAVIKHGEILGIVPKENLANYGEFYEKRWFASGKNISNCEIDINGKSVPFGRLLFELAPDLTMGVEICEDLWVTMPPSSQMALSGANLIVNCSAGNEIVTKAEYRRELVKNQSARCVCAYAYAGASVMESTTDTVCSGPTIICEDGAVLAQGKRFQRESLLTCAHVDFQKLNFHRRSNTSFEFNCCGEKYRVIVSHFKNAEITDFERTVSAFPFVPGDEALRRERCEEILAIQSAGLAKRMEHTGMKKCIVGISGGLDSTLALLVCVATMRLLGFDNSNVMGVTMPGFGTTGRTYNNALALMGALGVSVSEISIKEACEIHLRDIEHDISTHDVTYENTQARERTQVLMDLANKHGALLVGTGDLSENALGWCTYNGDHMSMYGVNASVPKSLVRYIVAFAAENSDEKTAAVLRDVLDTPVSPELLPPDEAGNIAQKTEENIGPYELHDFFLYHFVRTGASKEKMLFLADKAFAGKYSRGELERFVTIFIRRFFASQFKRSCTPDAPKVGSVSLSPRGDWRMPSDMSPDVWLGK